MRIGLQYSYTLCIAYVSLTLLSNPSCQGRLGCMGGYLVSLFFQSQLRYRNRVVKCDVLFKIHREIETVVLITSAEF